MIATFRGSGAKVCSSEQAISLAMRGWWHWHGRWGPRGRVQPSQRWTSPVRVFLLFIPWGIVIFNVCTALMLCVSQAISLASRGWWHWHGRWGPRGRVQPSQHWNFSVSAVRTSLFRTGFIVACSVCVWAGNNISEANRVELKRLRPGIKFYLGR